MKQWYHVLETVKYSTAFFIRLIRVRRQNSHAGVVYNPYLFDTDIASTIKFTRDTSVERTPERIDLCLGGVNTTGLAASWLGFFLTMVGTITVPIRAFIRRRPVMILPSIRLKARYFPGFRHWDRVCNTRKVHLRCEIRGFQERHELSLSLHRARME